MKHKRPRIIEYRPKVLTGTDLNEFVYALDILVEVAWKDMDTEELVADLLKRHRYNERGIKKVAKWMNRLARDWPAWGKRVSPPRERSGGGVDSEKR